MKRSSTRAALLAGSPEEVETAFYEALQSADVERLMACWSDDDDVFCIHPGSAARVVGVGAIREVFTAMLERGGLDVRVSDIVRMQALTSAVHSVVEHVLVRLPDGPHEALVFATNVYQKTPQGWRIVAHHASTGKPGDGGTHAAPVHVLH
ncbi:nuclear transport factor 2 family protein [Diaphorobacter ruginosibacter]|uniref:YybH family protein n=1 Tax=Diaphorobacter ruginosibacter TaxID=1715720 RepID=UPI00333F71F0